MGVSPIHGEAGSHRRPPAAAGGLPLLVRAVLAARRFGRDPPFVASAHLEAIPGDRGSDVSARVCAGQ